MKPNLIWQNQMRRGNKQYRALMNIKVIWSPYLFEINWSSIVLWIWLYSFIFWSVKSVKPPNWLISFFLILCMKLVGHKVREMTMADFWKEVPRLRGGGGGCKTSQKWLMKQNSWGFYWYLMFNSYVTSLLNKKLLIVF